MISVLFFLLSDFLERLLFPWLAMLHWKWPVACSVNKWIKTYIFIHFLYLLTILTSGSYIFNAEQTGNASCGLPSSMYSLIPEVQVGLSFMTQRIHVFSTLQLLTHWYVNRKICCWNKMKMHHVTKSKFNLSLQFLHLASCVVTEVQMRVSFWETYHDNTCHDAYLHE